MAPEKYIARSHAIAARNFGGETMIMSAEDSQLFSLNPVGSVIWEAADGATPLSAIVRDQVCAAFDVEPAAAYRDAEEFVAGLATHGILLVAEQPIPPPPAPEEAE